MAKEPFCQTYSVLQQDVNAITVPAEKQFILLTLYVNCSYAGWWQIDVNDTMWLMGYLSTQNQSASRDFPEGFAIVQSGKTLKLRKDPGNNSIYYTLIGYFRNTDEPICLKYLDSDINKDCRVDMVDLTHLAREWLECNLEPVEFCHGILEYST
jgi:hypothetical protein